MLFVGRPFLWPAQFSFTFQRASYVEPASSSQPTRRLLRSRSLAPLARRIDGAGRPPQVAPSRSTGPTGPSSPLEPRQDGAKPAAQAVCARVSGRSRPTHIRSASSPSASDCGPPVWRFVSSSVLRPARLFSSWLSRLLSPAHRVAP